jgi:hypothetical protein
MALEPKKAPPDFTARGKASQGDGKPGRSAKKKKSGAIPYPNLAIVLAQELRQRDRKKG